MSDEKKREAGTGLLESAPGAAHGSHPKHEIICPYCFNKANGGNGKPISDDEVAFRAESSFRSIREIENVIGTTEDDIEMLPQEERAKEQAKFEKYKKFLIGTSQKYQSFWSDFNGSTEEDDSSRKAPWELPIIQMQNGIAELERDPDGFVDKAIDTLGKETARRVCPFCNNPLPKGYGKYPVKYISIIGATHSGKTVYISQLLKNMVDYGNKVGLAAYFTSSHEQDFIEHNKVEYDVPLPDATTKEKFSQPMFYDITRTEGNKKYTDTIVLYDIAGENCRNASDLDKFAQYVMQSDGIILLIDPKQLGFISGEQADSKSLEEVFSTIHGTISGGSDAPSATPIAVCISKSDQCADILPSEAMEQVRAVGQDRRGFSLREFNSTSHNALISGSNGLASLIQRTANSVCLNLATEFFNFNFFTVSAIGCDVKRGADNRDRPAHIPDPKRIEEPILWLFRHFGYIGSNEKTLRPFPVPQAKRYVRQGFGPWTRLEALPAEDSDYEEDVIRYAPQVQRKKNGPWESLTPEELASIGGN